MPTINNAFYGELGDAWWRSDDHMIAFLRAETAIRLDYIHRHLPASPRPLRILDLGAGGGLISVPLAAMGHQVTALDIAEDALGVLQRKAREEGLEERIAAIGADITQPWPLPPGSRYDAILAMDVLEHVSAPEAIINQSARFLKPGGTFIYHTLNRTWLCWLIYLQLAPRIIRHSPAHVHVYDLCIRPEWMTQKLAESGFSAQSQTGIRPVLSPAIVWQLLRYRRVGPSLQFDYCRDRSLGYLGCAQLVPAGKRPENEARPAAIV